MDREVELGVTFPPAELGLRGQFDVVEAVIHVPGVDRTAVVLPGLLPDTA